MPALRSSVKRLRNPSSLRWARVYAMLARSVRARAAGTLVACLALAVAPSCARFGPVYPSRPMPSAGPPLAEPEPARVVAHVLITAAALTTAVDEAVPRAGDGTFVLLGSDRSYSWERDPIDVSFSQGRIVLTARIRAKVALPVSALEMPIDLHVEAEPVVSGTYAVRLQSVDVKVSSADTRLALADRIAGVYEKIAAAFETQLKGFAYDLKPMFGEAYTRVARPIPIVAGAASGCAQLRVLEVEAGPTVLADGIEKDVALVVAPSITLPCAAEAEADGGATLPPFFNVAAVTPGPFTVTIPMAASYDELSRAMTMAFTDGKLHFSAEYPELYLENPELYESQSEIVLKLHLAGPVHKLGIDTNLDGDLYLAGHPAVVDNELLVPDLEPTIETRNFLLSLKALADSDRIRDQARAALRLDIGARLREARDKLGSGLTFGSRTGCFHGDVDRIEVTGVHAHAAYLRVYVAVTARARLRMPCDTDTPGPG